MRLNPFGGSRRTQQADAVVTGAGSGSGGVRARDRQAGWTGRLLRHRCRARPRDRRNGQRRRGKAFDAVCDVSSLEQVTTLANTAEEWFGKSPDLVVNNAGIGRGGTLIGETPPAEWHQVLDINLWGVIHGCHVFTPRLRGAGHGSIVNVASAAAFGSAPRMAAYNVSKAGVLALSETLAAELSGTGVTVTVLCPTGVRTNILEGVSIGDENLQRWGDRLLRWTGRPPAAIARTTLDAVDRGQLYVVPQIEAKAIWQSKRLLPDTYTRAAGLLERLVR